MSSRSSYLRFSFAVLTMFACVDIPSSKENDVWAELESSSASGVALVLQPGECLSRKGDLAVALSTLPIRTIVVLQTGDTNDVSLQTLLANAGIERPIFVSKAEAVKLRKAGLATTPGLIVWHGTGQVHRVFPISTNRLVYYEQIRSIAKGTSFTGEPE